MSDDPTVLEIVDTMTKKQKEAVWYCIDCCVNRRRGIMPYQIHTLNANQTLVLHYLIGFLVGLKGDDQKEVLEFWKGVFKEHELHEEIHGRRGRKNS